METSAPLSQLQKEHPPLILLAETDAAVTNLLQPALEDNGFQVLCCESGGEAISAIKNHRNDVAALVSDVEMPGMNGFRLARLASELLAALPIVFLSSSPIPKSAGPMRRLLPRATDAETLLQAIVELSRNTSQAGGF